MDIVIPLRRGSLEGLSRLVFHRTPYAGGGLVAGESVCPGKRKRHLLF